APIPTIVAKTTNPRNVITSAPFIVGPTGRTTLLPDDLAPRPPTDLPAARSVEGLLPAVAHPLRNVVECVQHVRREFGRSAARELGVFGQRGGDEFHPLR